MFFTFVIISLLCPHGILKISPTTCGRFSLFQNKLFIFRDFKFHALIPLPKLLFTVVSERETKNPPPNEFFSPSPQAKATNANF